jgi:hypothetical protein
VTELPSDLRRTSAIERLAIRGGIVGAVLIASMVLVFELLSLPGQQLIGFASVVLVPAVVAVYFVGWTRWRRKLLACHLKCCLACHQDLRGLPDEGRCPECGRDYDIGAVQAAWEAAYPSLRLHRRPEGDDAA